jgi:hypothetical protein
VLTVFVWLRMHRLVISITDFRYVMPCFQVYFTGVSQERAASLFKVELFNIHQNKRHHIPSNNILNSHRRGNMRFRTVLSLICKITIKNDNMSVARNVCLFLTSAVVNDELSRLVCEILWTWWYTTLEFIGCICHISYVQHEEVHEGFCILRCRNTASA